ncbi:MAG: hypothetical protein CL923_00455 [Deltaproteobacteria bacterium]|nr:hypothetical protein [Deltaproteobacteria bacterium]MDP7158896.1 hypothetical protein [SAR324 cluster bacterium]MDP7318886.1 hypothetical protein [SAR324 cluster bacterium]
MSVQAKVHLPITPPKQNHEKNSSWSYTRGAHPKDMFGMQMRPMAMTLANDAAVNNVAAYIASLPE